MTPRTDDMKIEQAHIELYRNAARKYLPDEIAFLFIAESQPRFSDPTQISYFYFEKWTGNEMFFATVVKGVLGERYKKSVHEKREILTKLRYKKVWLTDTVEYPINKDENGTNVSNKIREATIQANASNLTERLMKLEDCKIVNEKTQIILIKKTVYDVLRDELVKEGFSVLNDKYIGLPRYSFDPLVVSAIESLCKR